MFIRFANVGFICGLKCVTKIKPSFLLCAFRPRRVLIERTYIATKYNSAIVLNFNNLPLQYCAKQQFHSGTLKMADNKFVVGYAKLGTSSCKKCKQKIAKTSLRIGKVTPNPFSEGDTMKQWFHPACIFETFVRARATTKKITEPDDLEDFDTLKQEDKDEINRLIDEYLAKAGSKPSPKPKKGAPTPSPSSAKKVEQSMSNSTDSPASKKTLYKSPPGADMASTSKLNDNPHAEKDNSFRQFRRLCADIAEESSYLGKTALVKKYITKGSSGDGFQGDLYLVMKLLLPGVVKVVYNLQDKQLVKLFSQIFITSLPKMIEDLDQGDAAETIRIFFEQSRSTKVTPLKKSTLSLTEVDQLLTELSQETKEDDQQRVLKEIAKRCTANDLKMVVRLIKHDLRIGSGAKHILDSLDENAYEAFQASRDLKDVISRLSVSGGESLSVRSALMTPVLPMLAEACRSVDQAMKKCPNGFYAEIKYDGERVQVHKQGKEFKYYSRSLKPVMDHKVRHFSEFIPQAFPTGDDLILDAEVLLVDTNTGNPLPFGTLGVHKRSAFQDAKVCLFIFDCLLINDENIMNRSIRHRRKILEKNMTVVKNRVNLSEIKHITKPSDLQDLMSRVFKEGLEGLVLKDVDGTYEPGKRHWLKVKKDYLHKGSMADSADLVVLGAYYGSGNKGGMMSVFLMGVYDPDHHRWVTVSKCGNGFDDKQLAALNNELDMVKISKDPAKVPKWLHVNKSVTPDFVASDPKKSPVWEIIGAEFSKAEIHTADGISIRFPRVQKVRDDKGWRDATDLPQLKKLFKASKEKADGDLMRAIGKDKDDGSDTDGDDNGSSGVGGNTSNSSKTDTNGKDTSASASEKRHTEKQHNEKQHSEKRHSEKQHTEKQHSEKGHTEKHHSEKRHTEKQHSEKQHTEKRHTDKQHTDKRHTEKRLADFEDGSSSPTKKLKPSCKFGAACYQTNRKHQTEYSHPHSQPQVSTSTSLSSGSVRQSSDTDTPGGDINALPDVFHGCKVVLPSEIDQFRQLKRYVVAFDGDILHPFEASNATHVVVDSQNHELSHINPSVPRVSADWLWTCIRKQTLVDVEPFKSSH